MEKTTQQNRHDILRLKELAGSMTFRAFWGWVCKNCTEVKIYGDIAHFRYQSVCGSIDAVNDCLRGGFECYDSVGLRCHTADERTYFINTK